MQMSFELSAAIALTLAASMVRAESPAVYDVWIRNGTVVDGTGNARTQADVLVSGDQIVLVGPVDAGKIKAKRMVDARGKWVVPGFIDTHAHGDATEQSFVSFLAQGITTVVLGQDGGSMSYPGDDKLPLSTGMSLIDQRGSEVNVATLTGHGTLRDLAGIGNAPVPTAGQLQAMKDRLLADMQSGSFGLSFGLEYAPGRYSQIAEQKALGDLVGQHGGIVMSHLRSEDFDKIGGAIDELLQIDAHVHVSHLKIVAGQRAAEADAVLGQLERARAQGKWVTADVYPYLASASSLHFLYPEWAKGREAYEVAVKQRRAELEAHLRKRVEERNGAQAILFVGGPHAGKRLSEVAAELKKPYEKVMIDDIGYGGPAQAHFLMADAVQDRFIYADQVMICTDGAPGSGHPRSAGSFIKILEEFVGPAPKMSLERAVYKMSGLPAQTLGLDRGVLAAGQKADLLILDPDNLHSRASWTESTLRPSGVDAIYVNGRLAYERGEPAGKFGRMLKRTQQ
ncbi:N-acyl-D-amino-acid deacylase family protein [Peristeroidobacter soli]|uniref:N-acyl-D-amino-acid deacylase family protein n=1 Tax=Peristeroidobacter soli TaxID=2497877 RepID=UPI00101C2591|nr:amidohydrolase family protein [Peristeroidobacter soli]